MNSRYLRNVILTWLCCFRLCKASSRQPWPGSLLRLWSDGAKFRSASTYRDKIARHPVWQAFQVPPPATPDYYDADSLGFSRNHFKLQRDCGEARLDVAFFSGHADDEDQVKTPGIVIHGIQRSGSRNDNGVCMEWFLLSQGGCRRLPMVWVEVRFLPST